MTLKWNRPKSKRIHIHGFRVINKKTQKQQALKFRNVSGKLCGRAAIRPILLHGRWKWGQKHLLQSPLCRKRFPVFTQEEKPQFPTFFFRILPRPLSRKLLKATFSSNIHFTALDIANAEVAARVANSLPTEPWFWVVMTNKCWNFSQNIISILYMQD